ncbi:MAG: maleylpyruvate isomerase family mycothiol-dependent enzyme [Actinomycetota bacterium]
MQEQIVKAIEQDRARLLGFLQTVASAAWDTPTMCTGWSVKDVVSHLVETDLLCGRVYRGEIAEAGPPDNAGGIARWSALPGEAVRAALWQHGVAAQRVLEAMTDEAWSRPIDIIGRTRVPQIARLHLVELCVHGHDITEALGSPALWGERLPFLAEYAVRAAPHAFRSLGVPPHDAFRVKAAGAAWTIDGRSGQWTISRDPAEHGIDIDPEDLVLVTMGRMPPEDALARATVHGSAEAARRIMAAWRVFPTPRSP